MSFVLILTGLGAGCGSDPYPMGPGGRRDAGPMADAAAPADARPRIDASDVDAGDPADASVDALDDAAADSLPPRITRVEPLAGALISGTMILRVDIADEEGGSGLDPTTVTATIATNTQIPMALEDGNRWIGEVDTRPFVGLVFPTIVVRAKDLAGNQATNGWEVTLDNVGPMMSLDPPFIREAHRAPAGTTCSVSFDPLGSDAVDDGETVAQLIEIRARVEDLSNTGTSTSGVFIPYAGVDPTSVQMLVLDDTDRPLIVDTNGDGVCDAINPELQPTSIPEADDEAALVDLFPLEAGGTALFTTAEARPDEVFTGDNELRCGYVENPPTTEPDFMCLGADTTRIVPLSGNRGAMIYSIPPSSDDSCMGIAFDARATTIVDGWACVALRGQDTRFNTAISPVLRMCVDSDLDGAECGPAGSIAPGPDCTGSYDPKTQIVTSATPCTPPLTFPEGGGGDYELVFNN